MLAEGLPRHADGEWTAYNIYMKGVGTHGWRTPPMALQYVSFTVIDSGGREPLLVCTDEAHGGLAICHKDSVAMVVRSARAASGPRVQVR